MAPRRDDPQHERRQAEWHHVARIHSMSDDMEICEIVRATLEQQGAARYACRLLNE
jgi:hypothetical protein